MNDKAKSKKEIEEEFTQYYQQYSKAIYRFCLTRVGLDAHKAEDCMQNTFIVLYRKLQKNEEILYPSTFLYRTADKIVLNTLSKSSKESTVPLDENYETAVDNFNETDSKIDYEFLIQRIRALLTDEEYLLFKMKYLEGLTLAEASEKLNISRPAAAKRLQRMRDKIKRSVSI